MYACMHVCGGGQIQARDWVAQLANEERLDMRVTSVKAERERERDETRVR